MFIHNTLTIIVLQLNIVKNSNVLLVYVEMQ